MCALLVNHLISYKRGIHNIEKEMEFKDNKLFIVHDSEGFEAGQEDEFQVVVNFIHARSLKKNINDRLHAIWSVYPRGHQSHHYLET